VNKQLRNGCYQPKPVKRVWIPPPGEKNEKRPLGIPAVKDRVLQQELRVVLETMGYFDAINQERLFKLQIKEGVRKWTKRCNGHAMEEIIRLINPRLRGWFGYFKQAHRNVHRSLDGWVRMRLRSIYRKRQKKRGRGRGSDHHRWPNRHFADLGLFSLEEAKAEAISLHNGGKR
jgi:hypothetical protein